MCQRTPGSVPTTFPAAEEYFGALVWSSLGAEECKGPVTLFATAKVSNGVHVAFPRYSNENR